MAEGGILDLAITAGYVIISLSFLIGFVRLALGPSLEDRVVALDLLTLLAMAYAALYAIASDEQAFLDVSIALALVAFLATVAFARFAERRSIRGVEDSNEPRPLPGDRQKDGERTQP